MMATISPASEPWLDFGNMEAGTEAGFRSHRRCYRGAFGKGPS